MATPSQIHNSRNNGEIRPQDMGRRQFQAAAVDTFNRQGVAISELQQHAIQQQKHREFVADLSVRVDCLTQWQRRGFIGRLKWFCLGK